METEKTPKVAGIDLEAEAERFLAEWRKVPDWDRYPLPEFFYTKFNVPKPKPNNDLMTAIYAQLDPPPHEFLGKEERDKAPGGVREIVVEDVVSEVINEEPSEMPKLELEDSKPSQVESTPNIG